MFFSSSWKVILPDRIPSAKHLVVPSKWFSWEILTRSVQYGREVTCAKPHGNDAGLQISSVVPPVSCKPSKRALRSAVKVKTNFCKVVSQNAETQYFLVFMSTLLTQPRRISSWSISASHPTHIYNRNRNNRPRKRKKRSKRKSFQKRISNFWIKIVNQKILMLMFCPVIKAEV